MFEKKKINGKVKDDQRLQMNAYLKKLPMKMMHVIGFRVQLTIQTKIPKI
jgi:hypothetical protein